MQNYTNKQTTYIIGIWNDADILVFFSSWNCMNSDK